MKLFALGIVVNVMIGIASGLAVQPIQRWWERRGTRTHAAKLTQIKREYEQALRYARSPELLGPRLITSAMGVTAIGCVGILGIVMTAMTDLELPSSASTRYSRFYPWVHVGEGIALMIFSSVLMLRLVKNGVDLFKHVDYFEDYVERVPAEVRDMAAEAGIVDSRKRIQR